MAEESFASLLDAFESINARKRDDPKGFSGEDMSRWKELRREIEKVLFQSAPTAEKDTREFLRVPVSLAVRYWTRNELKDRYIPVLGEGGLFVSAVDPLPVGSELDLEIVLARKGLSFGVKGKVVWVNQGEDPARRGMGIKFDELSYEQKRTIYGLVDDSLRQRLLERRRFARVDARLQVNFIYAEGYFELQTEDLGLGGMFIATDHLVPVGERVRLVLHVPGNRPAVKAVGEVVRVVEEARGGKPPGLGIRFVDLDPGEEETIRDYIGLRVRHDHPPENGERRRYPRIERLVKLRFKALDSTGTSLARDISSGGMFVQTHEPLPMGCKVQVSMIHPVHLYKLELVGTVVRVDEPDPARPHSMAGVGLSFEGIDEETRAQLDEFLRDFALLDASPPEDPAAG